MSQTVAAASQVSAKGNRLVLLDTFPTCNALEVVDAQPDNSGCEIDRSNDAYNAVAMIPHIAETKDTVDIMPKMIQDFVNRLIRHAKKCWIGQEALFEADL